VVTLLEAFGLAILFVIVLAALPLFFVAGVLGDYVMFRRGAITSR
jgi:hypothetical protein